MKEEENGSGIAPPELTLVEAALEEIIEKEKEFEKQYREEFEKQYKAEKDRKTAEEMRQESLENFAETKKGKLLNDEEDETEAPKVRKNRRSGTDTLAYLKEKSDKEMESKKEELQMKIKLQEEQLMEQRSMRQQQLQQQTELQQQQQQQNNQFMMMMMQMIQHVKKKRILISLVFTSRDQ